MSALVRHGTVSTPTSLSGNVPGLTLPVVLTDVGAGVALAERNVAANPELAYRVAVKELWWGTGAEPKVTSGAPVAVVVASDVVWVTLRPCLSGHLGPPRATHGLASHAPRSHARACSYDAEATGPLADTLAALCGPSTACFLGFRNRTSAATIKGFFDRLASLGFEHAAVPKADLGPAYRADDAHVLVLTKKK